MRTAWNRKSVDMELCIRQYQDGVPTAQLARLFGIDKTGIVNRLREAGIPIRPTGRRKIQVASDTLMRCVGGENTVAISREAGVSIGTIQRRLRDIGIVRGPGCNARKYALDEAYFDCIDTEEKAYWLGFIYADGSVRQRSKRNGEIRISLKTSDRGHLEKLKIAAQTQAPIKITHKGGAVTLTLNSWQMFQAVCKLGCVPRKTCNHGTPSLPHELMRHFYRGYVDGDGCLCCYQPANRHRSKTWSFYVVGYLPFLEQFQTWLQQQINSSITKPTKHKVAARIGYGGSREVGRITDLLYQDATVYLDRKYLLYQEIRNQNG